MQMNGEMATGKDAIAAPAQGIAAAQDDDLQNRLNALKGQ